MTCPADKSKPPQYQAKPRPRKSKVNQKQNIGSNFEQECGDRRRGSAAGNAPHNYGCSDRRCRRPPTMNVVIGDDGVIQLIQVNDNNAVSDILCCSRCSVENCCEPVYVTCTKCFVFLCLCHQDTACSDHILNTASGNVDSIPANLGVIEEEGEACQEENKNGAICTIDKCVQCVFHSCANCLSYLCYDHLESDCTERGYCSKSVDIQNSRTVITDLHSNVELALVKRIRQIGRL